MSTITRCQSMARQLFPSEVVYIERVSVEWRNTKTTLNIKNFYISLLYVKIFLRVCVWDGEEGVALL